jgi:hypothetical protein
MQLLSRREALKSAGVVVVAGAVGGSVAGCNASQWLTIALNDLPTIIQIAVSIISIVGAASGATNPAALALAQAAAVKAKAVLVEAQAFLTQYQANKSTTLLGNIDDALATAQAQLGSILSILNINSPVLQATLSAAIGSALTIIVAVQSLIPAPAPVPTPTPTPAASRRSTLSKVTATDQSIAIKVGYNEALAAAGGSAYAI